MRTNRLGSILVVCFAATAGFAEPPRTSATVGFRLDVMPVISKLGCNQGACHGGLKGKGGFKLSLRGDDPDADYRAITRDSLGRRVDSARPESSLLLLKPTGVVPHEGGKLFEIDGEASSILRRWIGAGCPEDSADSPAIVEFVVEPKEKLIESPFREQRLSARVRLSDGSERDVAAWSIFETSEPTRTTISSDGMASATSPVEATISVRFAQARGISRLAFLPDRRPTSLADLEPLTDFVDEPLLRKLESVRLAPSNLAGDSVFLRRAFLSTLGRLPTVEETREFLVNGDPGKRRRLAAQLVNRPEFADFWALKWADVLRSEEKTMGPKGLELFHRWLVQQMRIDRPMRDFASALLATRGSTWENPAACFHRTHRNPETAAEATAQVFLGYRLACAKCHNHPFDVWTQDDYYGLAAYFARVERKQIGENQRRDENDKHEINGDEIISLRPDGSLRHPVRRVNWQPKPLGSPQSSDPSRGMNSKTDPLAALAEGVTADPQFARNLANRVWYHLFGRGIVDPPDDFRDSNPPSNPELLESIADAFVRGQTRLKPLVRALIESRAFQLDSEANETNAEDEKNFSRYPARLQTAETLLDAIADVLEAKLPDQDAKRQRRAVQLPGARMGGTFLKAFGKPDRLLDCECERYAAASLSQAFQMINGPAVRGMFAARNNRISRLIDAGARDDAIVEEFYLAALCRTPTEAERAALAGIIAKHRDRKQAIEDIVWGLLNSKEFLLIR